MLWMLLVLRSSPLPLSLMLIACCLAVCESLFFSQMEAEGVSMMAPPPRADGLQPELSERIFPGSEARLGRQIKRTGVDRQRTMATPCTERASEPVAIPLPCPDLFAPVSVCSIKWRSAVTVISILNLVIFIIELIVGGAKVRSAGVDAGVLLQTGELSVAVLRRGLDSEEQQ